MQSPKFMNERSTMNVEAAVKRYEITHPVVNDANETMWTELGICCWPTVCIIGELETNICFCFFAKTHYNLKYKLNSSVNYGLC